VEVNNGGIDIEKNKARAERDGSLRSFTNSFAASSISENISTYIDETTARVDLHVKIDTGLSLGSDTSDAWKYVATEGNIITGALAGGYKKFPNKNAFILKLTDTETGKTGWIDLTNLILQQGTNNYTEMRGDPGMPVSIGIDLLVDNDINSTGTNGLSKLEPAKTYEAKLYYLACTASACGEAEGMGETIGNLPDEKSYFPIARNDNIKTADKINQKVGGALGTGNAQIVEGQGDSMPACSMNPLSIGKGTFVGCIAQGFYYVLFIPTSYLFALSGVFFDNTFAYSVQDTSYRSAFVVQGWGLVRDFCNMLFIFILLYVAIGTILSLHSMKTKETIINVVIIGLFINFSLFATQLIIDASNITARVFYNADTIEITEDGANGVTNATPGAKPTKDGVLPLSAALVNKVNPQNLIIHAKQINKVPIKGGDATVQDDDAVDNMGAGTFILIVIIATAVNLVGIIVFCSVGLIFITRVIGLWLAMILSPLAFFTYILPQMEEAKMIGWKNWWPETLKMAFLAPVFIFFMYIILKFLELDLISDPMSKDGLTFFIATLMPFAFIMILMMKAKNIATEMSGEIGQKITSKLAMAGGLALGVATGGAALLGRGTIGRLANKANNSNWLNDAAAGKKGKMLQFLGKAGKSTANYTAKSSFDVRQTKAGSAFSKETGLNLDTGTNYLGLDSKKTAGGYVAQQQRKIEKENKFKDSLGYDHHKYEEVGDEIAEKEAALAKYKAAEKDETGKTIDRNSPEYKARVAREEYEIANKKKEQERVKSGRAMEYALTSKRKSGKIYDVDTIEKKQREYYKFRDSITEEDISKKKKAYDNEADINKKAILKADYNKAVKAHEEKNELNEKQRLISNKETIMNMRKEKYESEVDPTAKKLAQAEYEKAQREHEEAKKEYEDTNKKYEIENPYRDANGNIKRFGHAHADGVKASKQIIKEFAKGFAQGAVTGGIAGSIVPGIGTGIGLAGGGLAGGIRGLMHYSGTTNRKVGEEHNTTEKFTSSYKAPSGGEGGSHATTDEYKEDHHDSGGSAHDEHK
jgi:hypothetical protein